MARKCKPKMNSGGLIDRSEAKTAVRGAERYAASLDRRDPEQRGIAGMVNADVIGPRRASLTEDNVRRRVRGAPKMSKGGTARKRK